MAAMTKQQFLRTLSAGFAAKCAQAEPAEPRTATF
jgi:hypothetical protein